MTVIDCNATETTEKPNLMADGTIYGLGRKPTQKEKIYKKLSDAMRERGLVIDLGTAKMRFARSGEEFEDPDMNECLKTLETGYFVRYPAYSGKDMSKPSGYRWMYLHADYEVAIGHVADGLIYYDREMAYWNVIFSNVLRSTQKPRTNIAT